MEREKLMRDSWFFSPVTEFLGGVDSDDVEDAFAINIEDEKELDALNKYLVEEQHWSEGLSPLEAIGKTHVFFILPGYDLSYKGTTDTLRTQMLKALKHIEDASKRKERSYSVITVQTDLIVERVSMDWRGPSAPWAIRRAMQECLVVDGSYGIKGARQATAKDFEEAEWYRDYSTKMQITER